MYYMKNANPPIVSEELFDKVNALLAEKAVRFNPIKEKFTEDYPLRLKIYCAECGSAYRLKPSKTKHWLCRNRDIGLRRCTNPQIAEDKVYKAFVKTYNRLVKNKETILVKMLNELKLLKERKISSKHEIYDISEEIAKLTKQVLVINKLQAQGYIESASYYEKLNEINAKISELTKEKRSLMGRDVCDEAIKTTTALIAVIDKKGAIGKFDSRVFEATVEKINCPKKYADIRDDKRNEDSRGCGGVIMANRYVILGYEITDGNYAVIENEKKIVENIFGLYLNGKSFSEILIQNE